MSQNSSHGSFSVSKLLSILLRGIKRLWIVVLLLTVAGGVLNGMRAWRVYTPSYTASVTFTVYVRNDSQAAIASYNSAIAAQMANTFPYILTSGVLSDLVKEDTGLSALPGISAESMTDTNVLTLSVTGSDPELCYKVLQSVIRKYPDVADFVVGPTRLNIIDETGVPAKPNNQRQWKNSARQGALAGFVLGIVIVLLYGYFKRTIIVRSDIEQYSSIRYLGSLPKMYVKKRSKKARKRASADELGNQAYRESLRALTMRMERRMRENDMHTLMVCSAASGEGKTTVSMNIARTLAGMGKKVLIMDCDLRNPSLYDMFGAERCDGLTEFLVGEAQVGQIIRRAGKYNLDVIFAGSAVKNRTDLMDASKLRSAVEELKKYYDYVIMDTSPVSLLADVEEMAEAADGALMVIRQDYASRYNVIDGITRIGDSGTEIIGYVLNAYTGRTSGRYGYGYGYGYGRNS